MGTKLTLSLNSTVISNAKKTLQTKDTSLSKLIENYFKILIETKKEKTYNSPIVNELTGIAKLGNDLDGKDVTIEYLEEKYK